MHTTCGGPVQDVHEHQAVRSRGNGMGPKARRKTRWHRVEMPTERVILALAVYMGEKN